ncbi:glutamate-5-semialdehyde dehydrogenase [Coralliovum pocilloporae]|uniref:glutamate-5-semialdehyde dehydrogenase n=1 Tax=Coralliovum pocilloporae TaxID=3066369 RepID=UPI0033076565
MADAAALERDNTTDLMLDLGKRARAAARVLAIAPTEQKNRALKAMAAAIRNQASDILTANARDVDSMTDNGVSAAFIDRGTLSDERIEAMAKGLDDIAALNDPVGAVTDEWQRPNGLNIRRVRTPLGVIGVIYESRPNVTADAGALCLKAGNAVILRGGSDSFHSSTAIRNALADGLKDADLPEDAIQMIPTTDRAAVGLMLGGLNGNVDVIVPRGGRGLVERVQTEARVPVFAHLDGICHVYIHKDADLDMARDVLVNAKMRRTGICGAAETLLVDRECAETHLEPLLSALQQAGCTIRGDQDIQSAGENIEAATEEDWGTEYLDSIISAKLVDNLDDAIDHIGRYGSSHTESIITGNQAAADAFQAQVDSAIVMHNASTQFADGGEFGMGAEIGIATGRMHARGPVGVEQLTSFKYCVDGSGQTRP